MAKEKNESAAPVSFTVKRKVVVPTIKLEIGVPVFVTFTGPILSKKKIEIENGQEVEKTIEIARVTNLADKSEGEFVVGTVLLGDLQEAYPEAGYVGKSFRIVKNNVPGKRYKSYELDEIEVK